MQTEKELLQVISQYQEYHCDWYNIPFNAISESVLNAMLKLMSDYKYYICGVVDGDGVFPKNFWEVETPMYCFKKLKSSTPLDNTKYRLLTFLKTELTKNNKISVSRFLQDSLLQNKLDRFMYEEGRKDYSVAIGVDNYNNFVFVEYKSEDEF